MDMTTVAIPIHPDLIDEISQASIDQAQSEVSGRMMELFDEHGDQPISDCWDEILDPVLQTLAWLLIIDQTKGYEGIIQQNITARLFKCALFMINIQNGGIER